MAAGTPKVNTAFTWYFKLVDATDFATPETGISPTVEISKAGAAFASLTGSPVVSEIANGWYKVTVAASDMNATAVILKATAAGCAQTDEVFYLDDRRVGDLPYQKDGSGFAEVKDAAGSDVATSAALATVDANIDEALTRLPDASPGGDGGLPTVDASNRIAGIQGTKNTLDDLNDFDPATTDVTIADEDLDDLKDSIKGTPDGQTVKAVHERAGTILARLEALVGHPVVVDSAVTGSGQDIVRYRGDTVAIPFDLGRDITGASLKFTVKRRATDPQSAAVITKTSAQTSEIEITDAATGKFLVKLTAGDTSGLLPDGRRAAFIYDVEMTLDGAIETVAAGDFVLLPDVTTG